MTADPLPRFSQKETRKLAEEAVASGFVYVDDDAKGHALFVHAESGQTLSLSETPGRGQIKRVRNIIARASGNRRGGFDRTRQREKQAALREQIKKHDEVRAALVASAEDKRSRAQFERQLRRRVMSRYDELVGYDHQKRSNAAGVRPGKRSPL